MTDDVHFSLAPPHWVDGLGWAANVVRDADGAVMETFALTAERLPPRKNAKGRVIWSLPTDGSAPRLGLADSQKLLGEFRDARRAAKKARADAARAEAEAEAKERSRLECVSLVCLCRVSRFFSPSPSRNACIRIFRAASRADSVLSEKRER